MATEIFTFRFQKSGKQDIRSRLEQKRKNRLFNATFGPQTRVTKALPPPIVTKDAVHVTPLVRPGFVEHRLESTKTLEKFTLQELERKACVCHSVKELVDYLTPWKQHNCKMVFAICDYISWIEKLVEITENFNKSREIHWQFLDSILPKRMLIFVVEHLCSFAKDIGRLNEQVTALENKYPFICGKKRDMSIKGPWSIMFDIVAKFHGTNRDLLIRALAKNFDSLRPYLDLDELLHLSCQVEEACRSWVEVSKILTLTKDRHVWSELHVTSLRCKNLVADERRREISLSGSFSPIRKDDNSRHGEEEEIVYPEFLFEQ